MLSLSVLSAMTEVATWQNALFGMFTVASGWYSYKLERSRRCNNGHRDEVIRLTSRLELHQERLIWLETSNKDLRSRVRDLESVDAAGA